MWFGAVHLTACYPLTHLNNKDKNGVVKGIWSPLRAPENCEVCRNTLLYYFVKPRAAHIGPLFPLGQPVLSTKEHSFFPDCLLILTTGLSPSLSVFGSPCWLYFRPQRLQPVSCLLHKLLCRSVARSSVPAGKIVFFTVILFPVPKQYLSHRAYSINVSRNNDPLAHSEGQFQHFLRFLLPNSNLEPLVNI